MKRILLGFLAYVVPTFITSFVWHLVAFHEYYVRLNIYRAEPIIPLGLGSMVIQGLVFSWAYPRLFRTARHAWFRSACQCGIAYGLLSRSFTMVAVAAKHPMSSVVDYFVIETVFTTVQFGLAAPLLALVWREKARA